VTSPRANTTRFPSAKDASAPRARSPRGKAAKKHGVIVNYDLNYRPSLWKSIGGLKKAQEVNREIAKYVDVMIGNEEDFTASLGFEG
jgi:sugar/nucleoside kinase (ribokinase family)